MMILACYKLHSCDILSREINGWRNPKSRDHHGEVNGDIFREFRVTQRELESGFRIILLNILWLISLLSDENWLLLQPKKEAMKIGYCVHACLTCAVLSPFSNMESINLSPKEMKEWQRRTNADIINWLIFYSDWSSTRHLSTIRAN